MLKIEIFYTYIPLYISPYLVLIFLCFYGFFGK